MKRKKNYFFKTVYFGYFFHFGPRTTRKCKNNFFLNGQNHLSTLLSLTFYKNNPLFNIDLFSQTFDIESLAFENANNDIFKGTWYIYNLIGTSSTIFNDDLFQSQDLILFLSAQQAVAKQTNKIIKFIL